MVWGLETSFLRSIFVALLELILIFFFPSLISKADSPHCLVSPIFVQNLLWGLFSLNLCMILCSDIGGTFGVLGPTSWSSPGLVQRWDHIACGQPQLEAATFYPDQVGLFCCSLQKCELSVQFWGGSLIKYNQKTEQNQFCSRQSLSFGFKTCHPWGRGQCKKTNQKNAGFYF